MKDEEDDRELQICTRGSKTKYCSKRFQYLWNEQLLLTIKEKEIQKYIEWEWEHKVNLQTKNYMVETILRERWEELEALPVYQQYPVWKEYRTYCHTLVETYREETRQRMMKSASKSLKIKKDKPAQKTKLHNRRISEQEEESKPQNFEEERQQPQEQPVEQKKITEDQQLQQQSPVSELLMKKSFDYPDKSKLNKEGWTWVAYCQDCHYQHKYKPRVVSHKKGCKKRRSRRNDEKQTKEQKQKNQYAFKQMKNQQMASILRHQHTEIELQLMEENRILKEQVSELRGSQLKENDLKVTSEKIALEIARQTRETIFETITSKLSRSIHRALSAGMDITALASDIRMKLVSKINYFDTDSIVCSGRSSLQEAHQNLMSLSAEKAKRTQDGVEQGWRFFSDFTDFDLFHQSRIIFKLANTPKSLRIIFYRYYDKLRKLGSTLPEIFKIESRLPWKEIGPLISFPKVLSQLVAMTNEENFRTVTDMYAYVCLGLLPPELKKVRIFTKRGNGAMLVRMKELKTNKIVIRYIPKTLIQLLKFSEATLPMNDQRIYEMSEQFYSKGRPFCSLRHHHSINIIEAIHKVYGQAFFFGYQSQDTFNLSDELIEELDKTYCINLPFEQEFIQEKIMIDLTSNQQIPLGDFNRVITIDGDESFTEGYEKDFVVRRMGPQILQKILQENSEEKQFLVQKYVVYKQFRKEILKKDFFFSLIDFFSSYLKDEECIDNLSDQMDRRGEIIGEKTIIQTAAKYIDQAIVTTFTSICVEVHLPIETFQYLPHEAIIIAGSSLGIHLLDQQISEESLGKYHLKVREEKIRRSNGKIRLSKADPKCKECSNGKLFLDCSSESMFRGYFVCENCGKEVNEIHYQQLSYKPKESVKIKGNEQYQIDHNCQQLSLRKVFNNLKAETEKYAGKNNYSIEPQYSEDIPSEFHCNFSRFSLRMVRMIKENRANEELLPLEIKESPVKKAGKGIFALIDIPENTLILTYVGTVASNYTCNVRDNSLFTLGYLNTEPPRELFVTSETICNPGRFFNSSDTENKPNSKPIIGLLDEHEIAIIMVSTRKIREGEQIFWEYGNKYWQRNRLFKPVKPIPEE